MKKVLTYLMMLSIFLDDFIISQNPVNIYFYYIIYVIVILTYYFSVFRLPINGKLVILLVAVGGISLLKSYLNSYSFMPIVKQLVVIFFSALAYYLVLSYNKFDVKYLFKVYLRVAVVVCILGFLQELGYWLLDIKFSYRYKVSSIVSEPSHLAITLAPAFFVAVNKLFLNTKTDLLNRKQSLLIFVVWILTMSAVAMLGFVAVVLVLLTNRFNIFSRKIKYKNLIYIITSTVVLTVITLVVYQYVPFIKIRVDDTWAAVSAKNSKYAGELNLSTYALYSNFLVTKAAVAENPAFGSGLGTHSLNYDRYIDKFKVHRNIGYRRMELNKEDANSMFLRILSELGIVGLVLFILFLYQYNIRSYPGQHNVMHLDLWLINNACLITFIMRLMRFGNYTVLGFFFFAFLLYYSRREHDLFRN